MELPKRKPNRIGGYDYSQNGAYFVTICTQDRQKILSSIVVDDAHIVPKPYGMIAEKYIRNVPEIEKYVIMPDHIHMIIKLDDGSMWASTPTDMDGDGSMWASTPTNMDVGADAHIRPQLKDGSMWASTPTDTKPQHNRVSSIVRSLKILVSKEIGEPIFQRSYYDHVIRNQKDYNEIWEYIENNPLKWARKQQKYE